MDLQLKGKVAVVTGASRGIGRAIAEAFADEGADVAICARNADDVAEAVQALQVKGVKVWGEAADIADHLALKGFIDGAAVALGGIDILVSNVSALEQGNSEDVWRRLFEVDLLGAVRSFEAAQPFLVEAARKEGDAAFLITASTAAAETDRPNAYGALKAALIHFAKGVARDGAAKGLRCNVISPGTVFFEGGVWDQVRLQDPMVFQQQMRRNPTGRMGTAEEVAAAVVFLASPRSAFTTGINLVVDGGLTRRVNY